MSPNAYIIAGPNGAGKTTFAREFLPQYADCKNFINADLIAQGVSPFSPESAAFRAGRLMLAEIGQFMKRRADFGFETTLSGKGHLNLIQALKIRGYEAHIFFLWLSGADLALARIRRRVREGGHDVPEVVVRRRFTRSIRNFLVHYRRLADSWWLFDNSGATPMMTAFEEHDEVSIIDAERYNALVSRFGKT